MYTLNSEPKAGDKSEGIKSRGAVTMTPKAEKNLQNGGFSTPLKGMKSCTVDRGCTPAPKDATKLAVIFRFFRVFPLTFQ